MRISDWSSDLCSSDLNDDFRRVLYTGQNLQLVLMALQPGEEIGEEVHEDRDQFFRVEKGKGEVLIDGIERKSAVKRKRVSVRVDLGGSRSIKKKKLNIKQRAKYKRHTPQKMKN